MLLWMKRLILPSGILLIVIQIFQPARTNPPTDPKRDIQANVGVDPSVTAVFARACNDCHSNSTTWPWYSKVAPASWLVVADVNRGRKALNFSEWSSYRAEAQRKHLSEVCKEVSEGEMPELPYELLHWNAKLNNEEVAAVCQWTKGIHQNPLAAEEEE